MLAAQISDSHLRVAGTRVFGCLDTHGALERAVDALLALDPAPEVVVHTGDVTNDGGPEDYAQAARILARLPVPVYVVPGNHDRRDLLRDTFGGPDGDTLAWRHDHGGAVTIGLDTLVEGKPGGRLGAEQLGWLDGALGMAQDRPALVFLHHPPFETGIGFMDRIALADAAELATVISRHRHVALVSAGHVHRAIQTRFAGTVAMTAPGTAHQVVCDLRPGAQSRWVPEPPAFLLHRVAASGVASHTVYIGHHGADAPFSGHQTTVGAPGPHSGGERA